MATSKYKTPSLGLLTIPVVKNYKSEPTYSWKEYESLTGCDLGELFDVTLVEGDYHVSFKPKLGKVIAVDCSLAFAEGSMDAVMPSLFPIIPILMSYNDDADATQASLSILMSDYSQVLGCVILVKADKTISFMLM